MTAAAYTACACWLNRTPLRRRFFRGLFRLLPIFTGMVYLAFAGFLFYQDHTIKVRFLAVPAVTFAVVSLLRRWLDFPRPYDCLPYVPFLSAQPGKGKSFPSRHTASAAAISLAFFQVSRELGALFLAVAVVVAISRVVGGVHYIRDVAAGFFLPFLFLPLYFI